MEHKVWEFEGDWYISIDDSFPFCMNQELACTRYIEALEKIKKLERMACDRCKEQVALSKRTPLQGE